MAVYSQRELYTLPATALISIGRNNPHHGGFGGELVPILNEEKFYLYH
jgi:hypothetical protein